MSTEVSTSAGESPAAGEESQTTTAAAGEGAKESGAPTAGEGGAGSKEAVLADLRAEREKRQALEAEIKASQDFRAKLAELLGGKAGEKEADPAELARQAVAERDEARSLNAVYQAAPAGTDVAALLDSLSFRAGLAEAKDIAAYVAQVVKENPRYTISAGVAHNLNQGNGAQPPKPKSIDDLIRGR